LQRLQADGFVPNPRFETSDTVETGIVIRTNPPGGTETEVDSIIDVFISTGSEEFSVPPVIGQNIDDAERLIKAAGLAVGQVVTRPDAGFEVDVVIEQSPAAGVEVGAGTPINLVVSSGPEVITLPDLAGMSQLDAIAQLTELGLKFSVNEEFSDEVAFGDVITTDPEAGDEVLSGDTILLIVSKGAEPVEVPSLIGLTVDEAQLVLDDLGLILNVSNSTQPVGDPAQDGKIVNQIPSEGNIAGPGDIVTVTIGEFQPPPTTTTLPPPTTTTIVTSTTTP
jgi:serine/threonine-protein kinase